MVKQHFVRLYRVIDADGEPPRVAWRLWGALGSVEARNWPHATVLVPSAPRRASNSTGVSIPSDECRRCRLWKSSRYSKSAVASSSRVDQACRSRSSTCTRLQNDSIKALSKQVPTAPIEGSKPASWARRVKAHAPYCVPWSLWITVGPVGRRVSMAILKAFVTSAAVGAAAMDQPTTRREHASSTTAQYT